MSLWREDYLDLAVEQRGAESCNQRRMDAPDAIPAGSMISLFGIPLPSLVKREQRDEA